MLDLETTAFRVQQNAAPLKQARAGCPAMYGGCFPRSTERGPIEARAVVSPTAVVVAFRVQQNAAPLKQRGREGKRRDAALSAFNRTRPH